MNDKTKQLSNEELEAELNNAIESTLSSLLFLTDKYGNEEGHKDAANMIMGVVKIVALLIESKQNTPPK